MCARKVLIITSSGGGGLLQAAIAKEQEERLKDPSVVIIKRDMLKDWYFKRIGQFGIRAYNEAQRQGDLVKLERLCKLQWINDILFWPLIVYKMLKTLLKEEVDHVIDTQPVCTSAVLRALTIYNKKRNKTVILDKIIVDLPTTRNTHYFKPLKWLFSAERKLLRLVTLPPLLDLGQTEASFWHSECRLPWDQVRYEYFPIRQAFKALKEVPKSTSEVVVTVQCSHLEEKKRLSRILEKKKISVSWEGCTAGFTIGSHAKVVTILLGSQPSSGATLAYVKKFEKLFHEKKDGSFLYLFVLCGSYSEKERSLFSIVSDYVLRMKNCPSRLNVIPLGVQQESSVASLFHRSDVTCTRSGGQTAMELMCVMRGEIWIHSESNMSFTSDSSENLNELLLGIPGWEGGSALYLHKLCGAKIVTPDTCMSYARKAFA